MSRKSHKALALATDVSALELAKDLNPERARTLEFLLMELGWDQGEVVNLLRKMQTRLAYEDLVNLMIELKTLCSIMSDRFAQLEQVLDEIVEQAPDLPEKDRAWAD
jgi:hypothetical protein